MSCMKLSIALNCQISDAMFTTNFLNIESSVGFFQLLNFWLHASCLLWHDHKSILNLIFDYNMRATFPDMITSLYILNWIFDYLMQPDFSDMITSLLSTNIFSTITCGLPFPTWSQFYHHILLDFWLSHAGYLFQHDHKSLLQTSLMRRV